jgi:hypothetical protein
VHHILQTEGASGEVRGRMITLLVGSVEFMALLCWMRARQQRISGQTCF